MAVPAGQSPKPVAITDLVRMLYGAGFRGADIVAMGGIAQRESGLIANNEAHNSSEDSYGLFQINWRAWGPKLTAAGIANSPSQLDDPATNVKAIRFLWQSSHYTPWGPYKHVSALHNVSDGMIQNALNAAVSTGVIKQSDPGFGNILAHISDLRTNTNLTQLDPLSDVAGASGGVVSVVTPFPSPADALAPQLDAAGNVISSTVSGVASAVTAVPDFLHTITNPELWKRVGIGALGLLLVVVAIFLLTNLDVGDVVGVAGKVAAG